MANRFQKFIYYLSALAPVLIIFAILWFVQESTWTEPITLNWKKPAIIFFIAVLLIIVFYIFFHRAKSELSVMSISGSEFKCIDGWLAGYVVTYMLPLASLAWGEVVWIVLLTILLLLIIVLTFGDHVTPHPLLFFKGYHFYELKVDGLAPDYKVISKKQIRNTQDINKVSRVFEFLLIRMG